MEKSIPLPECARAVEIQLKQYLENILNNNVETNLYIQYGQAEIHFYVRFHAIKLSLNLYNREFQHIYADETMMESLCLKLRSMMEKENPEIQLRSHEEAYVRVKVS